MRNLNDVVNGRWPAVLIPRTAQLPVLSGPARRPRPFEGVVRGAVAFAAALLAAQLATGVPDVAPWVGGGMLITAGIYQLTPLKDFCLRPCRSPVAFLLHVSSYKCRLRDLRVGLYHGLYCIGCCWG